MYLADANTLDEELLSAPAGQTTTNAVENTLATAMRVDVAKRSF